MRVLHLREAGVSPVSLATLKSFLKIDTNDEDTILQMCLDSATDTIQQYLKRILVEAEYDFWLDIFPPINENNEYRIFNASEIFLPFPPIILVKSIKTYNEANAETTFATAAYQVDQSNGRIFLNDGYTWPTDLRNKNAVKINYTCGMNSECPASLKQAVIIYASQIYNARCECAMPDSVKKMISGYKLYDSLGYGDGL